MPNVRSEQWGKHESLLIGGTIFACNIATAVVPFLIPREMPDLWPKIVEIYDGLGTVFPYLTFAIVAAYVILIRHYLRLGQVWESRHASSKRTLTKLIRHATPKIQEYQEALTIITATGRGAEKLSLPLSNVPNCPVQLRIRYSATEHPLKHLVQTDDSQIHTVGNPLVANGLLAPVSFQCQL